VIKSSSVFGHHQGRSLAMNRLSDKGTPPPPQKLGLMILNAYTLQNTLPKSGCIAIEEEEENVIFIIRINRTRATSHLNILFAN
jgi:hypothetical protein